MSLRRTIMSLYSLLDVQKKIQKIPRIKLIHLPTPFEKLENLSQALGGPEIFMKRDDLTGLAFGGNKSRKLEFIVKDMLEKKADVAITWSSLQSNWCLQMAAAARKFGIKPVLVLFKTHDIPEELDGNLLLDFILEAEIHIKEAEAGKTVKEEDAFAVLDNLRKRFVQMKQVPYLAPLGGSMVGGSMDIPLGGISYVAAFAELMEQIGMPGGKLDFLVLATGSGGTQAGLVVGAKALSPSTRILGISVSEDKETFGRDVLTIARDTAECLGLDVSLEGDDIRVFDAYVAPGYGIVTKEIAEAIRFVAEKEGLFLDPVYTGKAMAGLIDLIKKGFFRKDDTVVFLHTGGTPALFPYKKSLRKFLIPAC